jgi:hypothetical protein
LHCKPWTARCVIPAPDSSWPAKIAGGRRAALRRTARHHDTARPAWPRS